MHHVPPSEIEGRLGHFRAALREAGLDGAIIVQRADLYYFSGTAQNGWLIVPAAEEGEPVLAVSRSQARARTESPIGRQVPFGSPRDLPALLAAAGLSGATRLGLELDVLPVRDWFRLKDLQPGVELADVSMAIREQRAVKSEWEIGQHEGAAGILARVYREVPDILRAAEREIDACAAVEGSLRRHGHQALIRIRRFNMELAGVTLVSGPTASAPQPFDGADGQVGLYPPVPSSGGERRLRSGEPVMVDLVAGYNGYIVDQTRIFCLGRLADDELRDAHRLALDIEAGAARQLVAGAPCGPIYAEAHARAQASPFAAGFMGWGENQVSFLGHGVGLELDELPILTGRSRTTLAPGMMVAVEPKFFFGDRGGVGVENTWVVTGGAPRNLTAATPSDIVEI